MVDVINAWPLILVSAYKIFALLTVLLHKSEMRSYYLSQTIYINSYKLIKDSHREKALSNKTPALTKSANMGIWVFGKSNQIFIRDSWTVTKSSKK